MFKLLPRAAAATARTSSRSPTRARRWPSSPREHGFRRVFQNDPDIGGRYSALSYFGLVPAALMGVDVEALLRPRAGRRAELRALRLAASRTPGLWLGCALGELALRRAATS